MNYWTNKKISDMTIHNLGVLSLSSKCHRIQTWFGVKNIGTNGRINVEIEIKDKKCMKDKHSITSKYMLIIINYTKFILLKKIVTWMIEQQFSINKNN